LGSNPERANRMHCVPDALMSLCATPEVTSAVPVVISGDSYMTGPVRVWHVGRGPRPPAGAQTDRDHARVRGQVVPVLNPLTPNDL
jgi:hypothetical protein